LTDQTSNAKPIAWAGFYELTKPRLSLLSVITALVGYLAALPNHDWTLVFHFVTGTALCAGGAAALNQWWERGPDALMERTRDRPLPARQISPQSALLFGLLLSIVGSAQLYLGANPLTGILGAATILCYVLVYTPMKRVTRWATEVGAIPGAIPPLIGWAAAEGTITTLGWILFAILAVWQIPHFMAIAWLYRADYQKGDFPMLSVIDKGGNRVARWALINTCILLPISLLPVFLGYCQWIYGATAIVFGLWFLRKTIAFMKPDDRRASARRLFINSIIYLPAVLFSLVIDRWILG
jgi:heme o synthase